MPNAREVQDEALHGPSPAKLEMHDRVTGRHGLLPRAVSDDRFLLRIVERLEARMRSRSRGEVDAGGMVPNIARGGGDVGGVGAFGFGQGARFPGDEEGG